jgi:hypothetical protein
LLVTRALDSDANHEVARDFREVLTLGVEEGDPLVLDGVLLLEVDSGHIELVGADHLVSEDTLVHHLNGDCLHLDFARVLNKNRIVRLYPFVATVFAYNIAGLKEQVLLPLVHGGASTGHFILSGRVLFLAARLDRNQGVHGDTIRKINNIRI